MAFQFYRKENKYRNQKIKVGEEVYDSLKEKNRHFELKLLEKAGVIKDLQRQVKFVLIPTQREPDIIGVRGGVKKGKVIEQECAYIADFVYKENENLIVEDVKGYRDGQAYALFKIKRKLMLYKYGIKIKEV